MATMRDFMAARKQKSASTPAVPPTADDAITHSCGHRTTRKHMESTPCRECVNTSDKKRRQQKHKKQTEKRKSERPDIPRLPDLAEFNVVYNAELQRWYGELVIGEKKFYGSASGVFKLLPLLDQQYREWLSQQADKP